VDRRQSDEQMNEKLLGSIPISKGIWTDGFVFFQWKVLHEMDRLIGVPQLWFEVRVTG
jgi:hypothetical protein